MQALLEAHDTASGLPSMAFVWEIDHAAARGLLAPTYGSEGATDPVAGPTAARALITGVQVAEAELARAQNPATTAPTAAGSAKRTPLLATARTTLHSQSSAAPIIPLASLGPHPYFAERQRRRDTIVHVLRSRRHPSGNAQRRLNPTAKPE